MSLDPLTHSAPIAEDTEIVAELLLNSHISTPYALIVEGPEDVNLLSFLITDDVNIIHSTSGRNGVLNIIKMAPKDSAIGLVDRDFWGIGKYIRTSPLTSPHLDEPPSMPNVVMTDHHDLHMEAALALQDSWIRAVARDLWKDQKIKGRFHQEIGKLCEKLDSLLSLAFELAHQIAILRIISIARDANWAFSAVKANRWIKTGNRLEEYRKALIQASNKSDEDFANFFVPLYESVRRDLQHERKYIIGDHDLIDIFNQLIHEEFKTAPSTKGLLSYLHIAVDNNPSKIASLNTALKLNDYFIEIKGVPLIS